MSSDIPHLLDIADLDDTAIQHVLSAAEAPDAQAVPPFVSGLLFLSGSLRTRVGFAVATARLGGTSVTVESSRDAAEMTRAESFTDTLRTLAGMVDLLVVRTDRPLDRATMRAVSPVPVINGGDPGGEHPTQALIDLFAMEQLAGPVTGLHVGICGDLTLRATRSLLSLLSRRPPRRLTLIAPVTRRDHRVALSAGLASRTEEQGEVDFTGLDVLVLSGLPEGLGASRLTAEERTLYALTARTAKTLGPRAVVLSPLPVIDEISDDLRADHRVRIFDHSDLGVQVRMAVLQWLLAGRPDWASRVTAAGLACGRPAAAAPQKRRLRPGARSRRGAPGRRS
jgi:aspartate carbamoyltransferase catalytic subunit